MPHIEYKGSDGTIWPSATELTALLPQPWLMSWYKSSVRKSGWRGWQRCKAQSNRGMRIGTEVHGLIEGFIKKVPFTEVSGKYNSEQIADALYDKVNPLVKQYLALEPHVVSEAFKVHGTADAIVQLSEGTTVLDWKTSAGKSETHPIQLAIYGLAWNETHDQKEWVDRGVIARVDKKSKKLTVHLDVYENLSQYYPVVQALRTVWEYSKGGGD